MNRALTKENFGLTPDIYLKLKAGPGKKPGDRRIYRK